MKLNRLAVVLLLATVLLPVSASLAQDGNQPAFAALRDDSLIIQSGRGETSVHPPSNYNAVVGFAWSPDGHSLALMLEDQHSQRALAVTSTAGQEPLILETGALEPSFPPAFTPDGRILYAQAVDDPTSYRVRVSAIALEASSMPEVIGSFSFVPAGGGGSPLPGDWQLWRETSGFGGGKVILEWTEQGILHNLSLSGDGLGLLSFDNGEDRILFPLGDSLSQPEEHVRQAALSPDRRTVAAVKTAYQGTDITTKLVLIDLVDGTTTDVATSQIPERVAWAFDNTLYYSARFQGDDLIDALTPNQKAALNLALGGAAPHVSAAKVAIFHLEPYTNDEEQVYSGEAYALGRLEVASDGALWFSLIPNHERWITALIDRELNAQQATEADQLAFFPISIYRVDPTDDRQAEFVGENLRMFDVQPSAIRVQNVAGDGFAEPIATGQTLIGTLNDANPEAHYRISAAMGEWLRFEAEIPPEEESFEAVLFASDGSFIGGYTVSSAHEEWTGILDPLRIPAADDYRLVLCRVDIFSRGTLGPVSYHLTVTKSQIPLLKVGVPVEAALDDATTEAAYRYEGTAGERVEFVLEATSDTYAPAWVIEMPYLMNESHIVPDPILFTGMGTSGLRLEYTALLPLSGSYLIRISNGAATVTPHISGSFRLTLHTQGS